MAAVNVRIAGAPPAAPNRLRCDCRWATVDDLPQVAEVERSCGLPAGGFLEALKACGPLGNRLGVVAAAGGCVAGICLYEARRHDLRILGLAAHPRARRRGVGTQLIEFVVGKLPAYRWQRIAWAAALCRESDLPALSLYRSLGFRPGVLYRGYYPDAGEDAILMRFGPESDDA